MRYGTYVVAGLLVAAAACSTNGANEPEPDAGTSGPDSAAPIVDAAAPEPTAPEVELDAERPLACGETGFCETRLPRSDLGLPLSLRSVWVVGPRDVWSVSIEGFILHYDGTRWTTEYRADHELYAVWATPTSVWVGGEKGLLLHRGPAGEWSFVEAGHLQPIRAVYGTGDDDVWFTRNDSAVDHYDGSTLKTYPIDVAGLRITTVFGRPGFGTYAAGHVPGPLEGGGNLLDGVTAKDQPYVFMLSTAGILLFNVALTEARGFVPRSGFVTEAPDEGKRIFLVGYSFGRRLVAGRGQVDIYGLGTALLGRATSVVMQAAGLTQDYLSVGDRFDEMRPTYPVLPYAWNNIWVLWSAGHIPHWDGYQFDTSYSLAMGDVPPRAIFGAHSDPTDAWIVGDGFAMRRPTP